MHLEQGQGEFSGRLLSLVSAFDGEASTGLRTQCCGHSIDVPGAKLLSDRASLVLRMEALAVLGGLEG